MKIVVAGYRGLIGHEVKQALGDCALLTLGRDARADICCDLNAPEMLDVARVQDASVFIHAAGIIDEDLQKDSAAPAIVRATQGMQALLKQLERTPVKHFVYISSAHVYGPLEGNITELRPPSPLSLYGLLHYNAEQLIRAAVYRGALQSALILRPNAVYGMPAHPENFRRWSLIPFSFTREAVEKQVITLQSNGLQRRNFVSSRAIGEHIHHFVTCIIENKTYGVSIVNPLGPETLSIIDFARRVASRYKEHMGLACAVRAADSGGEPAAFSYGSEQGFQPPGQALDGFIDEMLDYLKNNMPHSNSR